MPFLVEHLLESRSSPIIAEPDEKVAEAIKRMVEHNFSQLPVIDADNKPIGMITSDSIVRALNNFGCTPDGLHVYDAMVQIEDRQQFKADEDLFDLLDDLRDMYAAVIVDRDGKLIGIVTTYDTTEYFRRRAEDMMLAREIERTIKDYILEGFKDGKGNVDGAAVQEAVAQISPSNRELRKPFKDALLAYVQETCDGSVTIDHKAADQVFMQYLGGKVNEFEKLALSQYIDLLLHKSRWDRYKEVFGVDPGHIRKLLHSVRDTRNDLAHLRDDVTAQQRDELQFCHKWLARHEKKLLESFRSVTATIRSTDGTTVPDGISTSSSTVDGVGQREEMITPKDSRYAPLALFLQQQPLEKQQLTLQFRQIEELIGDALPASARLQRWFWANDSVGHVQSQLWLEAGWRVTGINLTEELVTFSRIVERHQAYIDFFTAVLADLRKRTDFPLQQPYATPTGRSWQRITRIPHQDPTIGSIGFAFAIGRRARVDCYIDTGDAIRNKRIFDSLHSRKHSIEAAFERSLTWERLDEKRASRIAVYRTGSISSSMDELAELRTWGVETLIKFHPILESHLSAVVDSLGSVQHNGAVPYQKVTE